jgi:hypothetical protein
LVLLFCLPLVISFLVNTFYPRLADQGLITPLGACSPFATVLTIPIQFDRIDTGGVAPISSDHSSWWPFAAFVGVTLVCVGLLISTMIHLFEIRWRVAQ